MDYAIETHGLSHRFGRQRAVDEVSLHVPRGGIYGFLGRNGAGKTTTIRMLLGLLSRDSGEVLYFGRNLDTDPKGILSRVGSMIEYPGFYGNLTARENLRIYGRLHDLQKKTAVDEVLHLVSLEGTGSKTVGHFSLGMKQRLGIARALLHEPDILILDEPTNGLDPAGIREIRALLNRLSADFGKTLLVSSHLLGEVEQMADTIGILHEGRLLEEIGAEELHRRTRRCIVCRTDDPGKTAFVLEQTLKLTDYQVFPGGEFRIYGDLGRTAVVNKALNDAGIGVPEIHLSQDTLEEYFITLTGGDHA